MDDDTSAAPSPPPSQPPPPPAPSASDVAAPAPADPSSSSSFILAKDLNPFFTCPECEGYFRDPHVAICCLSTYCRDCLIRALRQPGSHCPNPKCLKYLGAKITQNTRPDPLLQQIMAKVFPQVLAEERAREAAFYKEEGLVPPPPNYTRGNSLTSGSSPSNAHSQRQSSFRASLPRVRAEDTPLHEEMFVLCLPESSPGREQSSSTLPPLDLPYLKVQRRTQVAQLRHVLVAALGLGMAPDEIEVLCQGKVLAAQGHNLFFIERTQWGNERPPLTLSYRRRTGPKKAMG